AQVLGLPPDQISHWRILRKSLDARDKDAVHFVYSAELSVAGDEARVAELARRSVHPPARVDEYAEPPFELPPPGETPLRHRPVIIGSGPAGLAAAYLLAEHGYLPLVLERGRAVRDRIRDVRRFDSGGLLDPESNYLFGEGGAGTFSDGKLTCRNTGPDVQLVLEILADCHAKPSILYEQRPHVGSNRLPLVVRTLRRKLEAFGGEVRFSCRVEDLEISQGRLKGLITSSGFLPAKVAILATGHSARDTYGMLLRRAVPLEPKAFQLGVRIEQPQQQVDAAR